MLHRLVLVLFHTELPTIPHDPSQRSLLTASKAPRISSPARHKQVLRRRPACHRALGSAQAHFQPSRGSALLPWVRFSPQTALKEYHATSKWGQSPPSSWQRLQGAAPGHTLGTLPLQAGPPTRWQHHTLARCQHLLQPHTHPGALSPPAEVSVQRPVPRQAAHAVNMPRRPSHAAPLKSSGARSAGGVERGHAHRPARFESCCRWAAAPASARPRSAAVCETPWALHTLEALSPRSEARWPRAAAWPPPVARRLQRRRQRPAPALPPRRRPRWPDRRRGAWTRAAPRARAAARCPSAAPRPGAGSTSWAACWSSPGARARRSSVRPQSSLLLSAHRCVPP